MLARDRLNLPYVDKTKTYNKKLKKNKAVEQILMIHRGSLVVYSSMYLNCIGCKIFAAHFL